MRPNSPIAPGLMPNMRGDRGPPFRRKSWLQGACVRDYVGRDLSDRRVTMLERDAALSWLWSALAAAKADEGLEMSNPAV